MRDKVRAGWAWVRARWLWMVAGGCVVAIVTAIPFAYLNPQHWFSQFSGLPARPAVKDIQPAKTLWDWAELLIVPLVLAVVGLLYSRRERQVDREIAEKQRKLEREVSESQRLAEQAIAMQRAMDDALKSYLDAMGRLLTDKGLSEPEPPKHVRNLARAYTLTVLNRVDGERRGAVVRFLYEAGLITDTPKVTMEGANLNEAYLIGADLRGANLKMTNLPRAVMINAKLQGANLHAADLHGANMRDANLQGANLRAAVLIRTILQGANLQGVNLKWAILIAANLQRVLGLDQVQLNTTMTYFQAEHIPSDLTPDPRPWPRPTEVQ